MIEALLKSIFNNNSVRILFVLLFLNISYVNAQNNKALTTYPAQNILISELMINPQTVPDKFGEWIEIFNPTSTPVNINGWLLYDSGSNFHYINNGNPLIIPPMDFIILGRSSNIFFNGGITPDYVYGGIKFDNSADEIILATGFGLEIDRIDYSYSNGWPSSNGESIKYTGLPAQDNNNPSFWQLSSQRENKFLTQDTDKGSPGTNGLGQNLYTSTTWTGNGFWTQGNAPGNSNWSNGSPGNLMEVIIIGEVEIIENVTCDNLIIDPFGRLTIDYSGNLDIEEDMIIHSDNQALVSGSFIDLGSYTIGGSSTFNRHIPDSGWHFLSSPINELPFIHKYLFFDCNFC